MQKKIFFYILLNVVHQLEGSLFYPRASSLSMTSSVSVPVTEFFPDKRIIVDWCFQMSYDLPNNPSSFYSVPIWPVKKVGKRELTNVNNTHFDFYEKYETNHSSNRHYSDFTAGELYQSIEDMFVRHGFHDTCLLKSVCNLARHPFDDQHHSIFTEILVFLLSPSIHQGFDSSEQLYRAMYENAERQGVLGEDCHHLYPDCKHDLLKSISETIF